jgi:hypothetical protein
MRSAADQKRAWRGVLVECIPSLDTELLLPIGDKDGFADFFSLGSGLVTGILQSAAVTAEELLIVLYSRADVQHATAMSLLPSNLWRYV